jgi:hypothetical protein
MTLLVTEVEFVGQGDGTEAEAENYEENLAKEVQGAAEKLSLRAVQRAKVMKVQVAEIKGVISL